MATVTDAVIDTVALVHHLSDTLPPAAARAFRSAENGSGQLFLPEIALGEFAYLALRGKLGIPRPRVVVEEVLDRVRASGYVQLSALGSAGWSTFLELEIPELHDRLIAADAVSRALPLISNDPELSGIPGLELVWK
jgi:predicted nucleic acid-binding protein